MPIPKFVKSVRLADYSQVINLPDYENTPLFSFVALSHTKIGFSDYKQDSTKSFRHKSGRLICNNTLSSPLFSLAVHLLCLCPPQKRSVLSFDRPAFTQRNDKNNTPRASLRESRYAALSLSFLFSSQLRSDSRSAASVTIEKEKEKENKYNRSYHIPSSCSGESG